MSDDWDVARIDMEDDEDLKRANEAIAQTAAAVSQMAADVAAKVAEVIESSEGMARALDQESDGLASECRQAAKNAEDDAYNLNVAARSAEAAGSEEDARSQTEYIEEASERLANTTKKIDEVYSRAPENVQRDHDEIPEQTSIVRSVCDALSGAASSLSQWWSYSMERRAALAENRRQHWEETKDLIKGDIADLVATGDGIDGGDPQTFYEGVQRGQRWSQEDDQTLAEWERQRAGPAANPGREEL